MTISAEICNLEFKETVDFSSVKTKCSPKTRMVCREFDIKLFCFGLDKCQVSTKTTLSLPLLNWTGRGNMMKGSRVETRTGRDHSPITVMDKTG